MQMWAILYSYFVSNDDTTHIKVGTLTKSIHFQLPLSVNRKHGYRYYVNTGGLIQETQILIGKFTY